MWQQCVVGDFTLVHNAQERERAKAEAGGAVAKSQGLEAGGDVDDEADDGINNNEKLLADREELMEVTVEVGKMDSIAEEEEGGDMVAGDVATEPTKPVLVVDVDGFETVQRGKGKKRSYKI